MPGVHDASKVVRRGGGLSTRSEGKNGNRGAAEGRCYVRLPRRIQSLNAHPTATHAVTAAQDDADAALATRGDVAAFERLYHRHAPRMHSLARRLLGASEADDAVQDVFMRAWSKLDTFHAESAFGTWLHRLAINVCLRRAERARRATHDESADVDALAARTPDSETRIDLTTALEDRKSVV